MTRTIFLGIYVLFKNVQEWIRFYSQPKDSLLKVFFKHNGFTIMVLQLHYSSNYIEYSIQCILYIVPH